MGVICILLGIITFLGFTGAGALIANTLIDYKITWSRTLTSLSSISNASVLIGVISFFAFIGLLIGLNLVMQGLTYNRLSKLYRMANRGRRK